MINKAVEFLEWDLSEAKGNGDEDKTKTIERKLLEILQEDIYVIRLDKSGRLFV